MGLLVVNSDFEKLWGEPMPSIAFDNTTYSLAGEVGTELSTTFAVIDNNDMDVSDQCTFTFSNEYVHIEEDEFVCEGLAVGTYTTEVTATYSYKSATVTATATINISVEEEKATSISFGAASYTISGNEHAALSAQFNVEDNLGNDITSLCAYSFSPNDKGVYADGGYFKVDSAIAGTYNITVTATYGELTNTATIAMSVVDYPDSISFDSNSYTMTGNVGDTITQAFTVTDDLNNNVTSQCTYAFSPNNTGLIVSGSSFDASSVAEGTYSVTVTATYTSGNGSTLTATATIDIEVQSAEDYFTFEALESGTFTLTINQWLGSTGLQSVSYSVDNGDNWVTTQNDNTTVTITTPTVAQGDTVLWKGVGDVFSREEQYSTNFSSTGRFNVSGSIMSLVYGDDFRGQKIIPTNQSQYPTFGYIFKNCNKLVSVDNQTLPATTLTSGCYGGLFKGCTSLTTAPELPATTLATGCYNSMFYGCSSLTTAPVLSATTMLGSCYMDMFKGCTSLTTLPTLPATTLANGCYKEMFQNCTGITTIPSNYLTVTTLAPNCYQSMFEGCTNLATVPSNLLPATTFESSQGDSVYKAMFKNCTSLTTAPDLPALSVPTWYGYEEMFSGCSSLNYVKAMFTTNIDSNTNYYTKNWLNGVAANGTFVKNAEATWTVTGASGIPSGWTVETATA